jgi:hypothetical protein
MQKKGKSNFFSDPALNIRDLSTEVYSQIIPMQQHGSQGYPTWLNLLVAASGLIPNALLPYEIVTDKTVPGKVAPIEAVEGAAPLCSGIDFKTGTGPPPY